MGSKIRAWRPSKTLVRLLLKFGRNPVNRPYERLDGNVMHRRLASGLLLLAFMLVTQSVYAQSNQFRGSRAHLGVAVGVFTYHGPVDLNFPRSSSNFDRVSDPALVFLGSFPIASDRLYFRGMLGFTNFDNDPGPNLVSERQNEFLTQDLLFFEPEIVWTLRPGSRSRFLPYVFTGFGGLLADPYDEQTRIDLPGTGVPGPERSVFAIPLGAGVDWAVSRYFSFFFEGSWRFNLNYVLRNEENYNDHNTSLFLGGIRIGLKNPFRSAPPQNVGALPPAMRVPDYRPPTPEAPLPAPSRPQPQVCTLTELNTIFFAFDSVTLDAQSRARLDENIQALQQNPACCITIEGYTDRNSSSAYAFRLSQQRAQAVFDYYVGQGVDQDRLKTVARGVGFPPCGKEDEGPGCQRNRRVESIPVACIQF